MGRHTFQAAGGDGLIPAHLASLPPFLSPSEQAFVEFAQLDQACAIVAYYSQSSDPAKIRGRPTWLSYRCTLSWQGLGGQGSSTPLQPTPPHHPTLPT